jgi:hypothetical protein
VLHFVALFYIGFGGFIAWRWPKTVFIHVFFAIWGILVTVFPIACPLTSLENYFRHLQGLGDLPGGFNAYYIYDTLLPRAILPFVGIVALLVLAISYAGVYYHWRRRAHNGEPSVQFRMS